MTDNGTNPINPEESFGVWFTRDMARNNFNYRSLAKAVGISRQRIMEVAKDEKPPSLHFCKLVAPPLRRSVTELLVQANILTTEDIVAGFIMLPDAVTRPSHRLLAIWQNLSDTDREVLGRVADALLKS